MKYYLIKITKADDEIKYEQWSSIRLIKKYFFKQRGKTHTRYCDSRSWANSEVCHCKSITVTKIIEETIKQGVSNV